MVKQEEEFFWLELKPQQKFKDDEENNMLKIIQHASEFAFFVFRDKAEMKMIVRTAKNDQNLFKTIAGVTAEPVERPHFGNMVSKYLTLKNKHSMIPLVDLRNIAKSNLYSKLWTEEQCCIMVCFVCDQTKKISSKIDKKINTLERRASTKGVILSGRDKAELAAAKQKREGHSYYNCTVLFGVQTGTPELSEIHAEKQRKVVILDRIISNVLLNSFEHRTATHRVRFSFGKKSFRQRLAEMFGVYTIDPYTFVPRKSYSKSMVLTEVELAFFISLPQEHDVQTINFDIGPTPTFVHGITEEMGNTDLTTDF